MCRKQTLTLATLFAVGMTGSAWAQFFAFWNQPYSCTQPRLPTVTSIMDDCQTPQLFGGLPIAMDDFQRTTSAAGTYTIRRIRWWGSLVNPQTTGRYIIRIWTNTGNCQPNQVLTFATRCVIPTVCPTCSPTGAPACTIPGSNCEDKLMYRFDVCLDTQMGGPIGPLNNNQKYWLQISEDNQVSASPAVDFQWATRLPVRNCPAVQTTSAAMPPAPITPITVACPGMEQVGKDLAFALFLSCGPVVVPGVLHLPAGMQPAGFLLGARMTSANGDLVEMPFELQPDNSFEIEADLPDGNYLLEIHGMGIRPIQRMVQIAGGMTDSLLIGENEVHFGDGNNDGAVNGNDQPHMVRGLLQAP